MATVSVSSHFGTQEKKICHYFQFSPFNLSWSDGIQRLDVRLYILSFMPTFSLSSLTLSEAMNNATQGHPRQMNHTEELWESITPLQEGMASNYSILVERTPWTVWKGKKIWGHKMSTLPPTNLGQKMSNILLGKSRGELSIAPERIEQLAQTEMMFCCECVWWWKQSLML